jgi:SPP1 family predicted phage head-tail adaptor
MTQTRRHTANDYDTLVELRRRVLGSSGLGGERADSWPPTSTYATVWAKRQDTTGNKRFIAHSLGSDQLVEFTIRYRGDVLSTDHIFIVEDGSEHEINQVGNIGRREEQNMLCRRITE